MLQRLFAYSVQTQTAHGVCLLLKAPQVPQSIPDLKDSRRRACCAPRVCCPTAPGHGMSPPLSSPAPRPPGIRTYATLIVALAAFLASMVVLRVPFRGYLIEARLSGRLGDGLDAAGIASWFKTAAPGVSVRVDAAESGHCDAILQQIAPRAGETQIAINRVARQFAEHYVAERREAVRQARLARLQAELQTARDTEDAVRSRLDELRQGQMVHSPSHPPAETLPAPLASVPPSIPTAPLPTIPAPLADDDARTRSLHERLASLRAELASLLGNCTEAHPKVITLRLQIAGLEQELAAPGSEVARRKPSREARVEALAGPRHWARVEFLRVAGSGIRQSSRRARQPGRRHPRPPMGRAAVAGGG